MSVEELQDKLPNIVENANKRDSLRGPEESVDKRITVKVFMGTD